MEILKQVEKRALNVNSNIRLQLGEFRFKYTKCKRQKMTKLHKNLLHTVRHSVLIVMHFFLTFELETYEPVSDLLTWLYYLFGSGKYTSKRLPVCICEPECILLVSPLSSTGLSACTGPCSQILLSQFISLQFDFLWPFEVRKLSLKI